jgi:hypothetical protein
MEGKKYCKYPNRFTDTYGLKNNLGLTTGDYGTATINIGEIYGLPLIVCVLTVDATIIILQIM